MNSIAASEKLFSEILDYFLPKAMRNCVIRVDPQVPMSEWKIVSVHSPDQVSEEEARLELEGWATAGFIAGDLGNEFFFRDKVIFKAVCIDTMRVTGFADLKFPFMKAYSKLLIAKELAELKKFLS